MRVSCSQPFSLWLLSIYPPDPVVSPLSHSPNHPFCFIYTVSLPRLIIKKLQSSAGIFISVYRSSSPLQTWINTASQKHTHTHIAKWRHITDFYCFYRKIIIIRPTQILKQTCVFHSWMVSLIGFRFSSLLKQFALKL